MDALERISECLRRTDWTYEWKDKDREGCYAMKYHTDPLFFKEIDGNDRIPQKITNLINIFSKPDWTSYPQDTE